MLHRFLSDDRGSVTIEFVLWVPIFAVLMMLASDTSFMFLTMTRMENASRDAARRVSMGQLDRQTVSSYVMAGLDTAPYTISADCSTADYACVQIRRPVSSIVTFSVLSALLGETVATETKMRLEPGVTL